MDNLTPLFPGPESQFVQGKTKEDYEKELKEKALPFNIVKSALANLKTESAASPLALSEKVSRVLTDLSNDDFSILGSLPRVEDDPILHESLFHLVDIYKQIKIYNEIVDVKQRESFFQILTEDLLEVGDIDKAIEIANKIVAPQQRENKFAEISEHLAARGDFDRAVELANKIGNNDYLRNFVFKKISKYMLMNNNIDKAIEATNKIDQVNDRVNAIFEISSFLEKKGDHEKSAEVATKAYSVISEVIENIDKIIEKAKLAPRDDDKDEALSGIIYLLLRIMNPQNVKKAFEVADMIIDDDTKAIMIDNIKDTLKIANKGG